MLIWVRFPEEAKARTRYQTSELTARLLGASRVCLIDGG